MEFEFSYKGEEYLVEVGFEGKYRPATWDWRGGDPEEFPEMVIKALSIMTPSGSWEDLDVQDISVHMFDVIQAEAEDLL